MNRSTSTKQNQNMGRSFVERIGAWWVHVSSRLKIEPPPVPPEWFSDAEVAGYDSAFPADDPRRIDDATWRDLEVKVLLRRIADSSSIYARQYLYQRLRRGGESVRGEPPEWMGNASDNLSVLEATAPARFDLRRQEMEVTAALFHDGLVYFPSGLRHVRWAMVLWIVAVVVLLSTSALSIAASLTLAYLIVWGGVEIRFHARLQRWKRQRRAVLAMLRVIVSLGKVGRRHPHPVLAKVANAEADAQRLLVALDLDAMEHQATASDYVNLLTLREYAVAPARSARLCSELPALRALYALLAECDGHLALMAWIAQHGEICWAQPAAGRELRLLKLRNPLLLEGQLLSLDLHGEGVFLSGENGVGKSTLLRAVGLNLLLARAFGFCHAAEAKVPAVPVWSSMTHEDSIELGDSLYMAEMRRAETLLEVAVRSPGVVFLIDEIFRGTNHVESVAGAAAVLNHLAANGLVIASSHNVVLAPLLSSRLTPLRVARNEEGLTIEPGVLLETNGLALMERYAIPDSVRREALRVHDWFSGYIATPMDFPSLA